MSIRSQEERNAGVTARIRAAGKRALKEAEARRGQRQQPRHAKEIGGPAAPEPTRHGDWERKGIASDF